MPSQELRGQMMRSDILLAKELRCPKERPISIMSGVTRGALERCEVTFDIASLAVKNDCSPGDFRMDFGEIHGYLHR